MTDFNWGTDALEVVRAYPENVKGKIIVVTGASEKGLGAASAIALAHADPAQIVLTARQLSKVQSVLDDIKAINPNIKTSFVAIDLSSIADTRKGAAEVGNLVEKIDILINNAGIMATTNYTKSVDGIELQLATNHVGHFLFTNLLLDKVLKSGKGARIVNLTSRGHRLSPFRFDDYNFSNGATYNPWIAYGASKTANILFTRYLATKLASKGILSFSVQPGAIFTTSLADHIETFDFAPILQAAIDNTGRAFTDPDNSTGEDEKDEPKTLGQGAATTIVAALDPTIADRSGSYLVNGQITGERPYAKDPENIQKLWDWSEKIVGQKFEI